MWRPAPCGLQLTSGMDFTIAEVSPKEQVGLSPTSSSSAWGSCTRKTSSQSVWLPFRRAGGLREQTLLVQAGETQGGVAVCRSWGQTPLLILGCLRGSGGLAESPGAQVLAAAPVGGLFCHVDTSAGRCCVGALVLASDASGLASTSCQHQSSPAHHWLGTMRMGTQPCLQARPGSSPSHQGASVSPGGSPQPHARLLLIHPECLQVGSQPRGGLALASSGLATVLPHRGHTAHCSGGLPCPSGGLPQSAPHDRRVHAAHRGALLQHGALETGGGMPWAPKDISHLRPLLQDWEE